MPGDNSFAFLISMSAIHWELCAFSNVETDSVEERTCRRSVHSFCSPIGESREPRPGFGDALKPIEQSICQSEHCMAYC